MSDRTVRHAFSQLSNHVHKLLDSTESSRRTCSQAFVDTLSQQENLSHEAKSAAIGRFKSNAPIHSPGKLHTIAGSTFRFHHILPAF
jgi:hypothetical protein